MNGTRQIAQRYVNAEEVFFNNIIAISSCSKADAEKVLSVFIAAKVAKVDPIIGRVIVKHGAFMEAQVIQNAISA